jgi:dTDP-4-amino-4,6-dideoxygalactose transaminase
MERRYHNEIVGLNNRMTETAAAIGRVQLRALPRWNERRREVARAYDEGLRSVRTPVVAAGNRHVYHQYTVRLPDRDRVLESLRTAGVEAAVYYPVPVHRLPTFAGSDADLPHTEQAMAEVLSLPVHPHLTDDEVAQVVQETRLVSEALHV